jgi:hypothetical protein
MMLMMTIMMRVTMTMTMSTMTMTTTTLPGTAEGAWCVRRVDRQSVARLSFRAPHNAPASWRGATVGWSASPLPSPFRGRFSRAVASVRSGIQLAVGRPPGLPSFPFLSVSSSPPPSFVLSVLLPFLSPSPPPLFLSLPLFPVSPVPSFPSMPPFICFRCCLALLAAVSG